MNSYERALMLEELNARRNEIVLFSIGCPIGIVNLTPLHRELDLLNDAIERLEAETDEE